MSNNTFSKKGNFWVQDGKIENSDINMSGLPIINLSDPINPTDAVNLRYLQNYIAPASNFIVFNINLIGDPVVVSLNSLGMTGNYEITISNSNVDSPLLYGEFIKLKNSIKGHVHLKGSIKASNNEVIQATWTVGDYIKITKKNGTLYDGIYNVKAIIK